MPALDGVGTSGDGDGVPGDAVRPGESGAEVRRIRFGDKVALDELGPIIVNEDCTMRRIANWETLSPRERRGVQKRVVRRNEERLERCRALEAEGKLPRARAGTGTGTGTEISTLPRRVSIERSSDARDNHHDMDVVGHRPVASPRDAPASSSAHPPRFPPTFSIARGRISRASSMRS